MCFSATASFTASITLSAFGIATIQKTSSKRELLLSFCPLLFAIQQLIEGIIWLSFSHPSLNSLASVLAASFLFFATLLWPIYCPLSAFLVEKSQFKRSLMFALTCIGLIFGTYLYSFVLNHGIYPQMHSGHILYDLTALPNYKVLTYCYLFVTSFSFLISSNLFIQLFGLFTVISFWIANRFYETTFVSVWCFFAAILSAWLYIVFASSKEISTKPSLLPNE